MTQKIESPMEIHADHRRWKSESSMWRDDIEFWQQEYEGALKALEYSIALLKQSSEALSEHVTAIERLESSFDHHEKHLAESLQSNSDINSALDEALVNRLVEQENKFAAQRKIHEQLKKRNHIAVAQITAMVTALTSRDKGDTG